MALPANILQQVQTYQMAGLAYLDNLNCFIGTTNKKFKDFEKMTGNLGDQVSFDLPPRMTTTNSLVAQWQPAVQRVQNLICNNPVSSSFAFNAQQFIFNVEDYMKKFGKSAIEEIGAEIEANVATACVTNTFRFYGDGVTPINSYTQLAQMLALFRNFGSAKGKAKCYISDIMQPNVVGTGLNQFALDRNNKIANSWELGEFSNAEWYISNLLPVHTAGTEGQTATTLTVVATTLDNNGAVTAIEFSGCHAANDVNSIKQYDKFQFNDGVAGQTNVRYLTFIGHKQSQNHVQFQALADATSTGASHVTFNIYPPLQVQATAEQNINTPIVAGMTVSVLPSHRAGLVTAGDPFYLAMPKLPDQRPYDTSSTTDKDTGVSLRMTYGSVFGQNQMGFIYDCIYGFTLVPEYSMSIIIPL